MHTHLLSTETVPQLHHVYLVHIAVTTLQPRPSFYRARNFFFLSRGAPPPRRRRASRATAAPPPRRRRASRAPARATKFLPRMQLFFFKKKIPPAARARGRTAAPQAPCIPRTGTRDQVSTAHAPKPQKNQRGPGAAPPQHEQFFPPNQRQSSTCRFMRKRRPDSASSKKRTRTGPVPRRRSTRNVLIPRPAAVLFSPPSATYATSATPREGRRRAARRNSLKIATNCNIF